jgi:hypothetical protein
MLTTTTRIVVDRLVFLIDYFGSRKSTGVFILFTEWVTIQKLMPGGVSMRVPNGHDLHSKSHNVYNLMTIRTSGAPTF